MTHITIQGILIKHTETHHHEGKPYTAYRIDIQAPVRQYHLWKRYSDFVRLDTQLNLIATVPVSLPAKRIFPSTFNAPDRIEQRRHGLEHYLRTLQNCRDDRWRTSNIWTSFLALPIEEKGRMNWLDEYDRACTSARHIRSLVNSRALYLTQHAITEAMQCEVQAKKEVATLTSRLEQLEHSENVTEGEHRRRQDKLDALKEERRVLLHLVAHAPRRQLQEKIPQPSDQDFYRDVGFQKTPPKHKPSIGKGRALGIIAKETEATHGLDNSQLVDYQKQLMNEQDMHLEQFRFILARQKELGYAISDELDAQVEVLNDLNGQVDGTGAKLQCASKRLAKIH